MNRLDHTKQPTIFLLIGFILTCLYALTKIHTPSGLSNSIGLPMILLGFYSIYRYGKDLSVKTPMLLLLASIIIPLISWYFAHASYPEITEGSPRLDKLARIFLFIPIAWWLKDSSKKVFVFWSLAALTILFAPWLSGGGWQEIASGLHGNRITYGLRNWEHVSLFFGFVLIGLICFSSRIFKLHRIFSILWAIAILFCCYTIAASQTRAAWLALLAVLGVAAIYFTFQGNIRKSINIKYLVIGVAIALIAGLSLHKSMGHILEKRIGAESGVMQHILKGDIENVPYTSIGIRIHMWRASIDKIKDRPITGWGNNGQFIAIHNTDWMPENIKKHFGHIHNIYIALLTNYGLIGFIFYFIWFGWILTRILRTVAKGYLKKDIGYFAVTSLTFWSVISLFESYLFFWTGVLCLQVIFGGLLAFLWNAEINNNTEKKDNSDRDITVKNTTTI